ncbi:DUF2975 domain-containing protein [Jeotgalicoccus huakuii]|nr:DUF2975 domain-containing protein [Jeotgalicoccus huakuii]
MTNQIVSHKRFKALVSVMYVISLIALILVGIATLATLVASFVLIMVPVDSLMNILSSIPANFTFEGEGFSLAITDDLLSSVTVDKTLLVITAFVSTLSIVPMFLIIYFLYRWLNNLRKGDILVPKNSKYIEYIGYSFVLLSLMETLLTYFSSTLVSNALAMSSLPVEVAEFLNIDSTVSFNFITIFAGILIWIIAKTMQYGAFLQDEYDATV